METTEIYISYENYCETLELIEKQYGKPYDIKDDIKTSIINMCVFDLMTDPLNCWQLMTDSYIIEAKELCNKLGIEVKDGDDAVDFLYEAELEVNDNTYRYFTNINVENLDYIIMERF